MRCLSTRSICRATETYRDQRLALMPLGHYTEASPLGFMLGVSQSFQGVRSASALSLDKQKLVIRLSPQQ